MKLSQFKQALVEGTPIHFSLEDGSVVPEHFHLTEIGRVTKKFIDCGGTLREEEKVSFQLWYSEDVDHRLETDKLQTIIRLGEEKIGLPNAEIEVEYQNTTIGKYTLELGANGFILGNSQTACLALDSCGIPAEKALKQLASMTDNTCTPGGGCC
jgi:hypothetical protein